MRISKSISSCKNCSLLFLRVKLSCLLISPMLDCKHYHCRCHLRFRRRQCCKLRPCKYDLSFCVQTIPLYTSVRCHKTFDYNLRFGTISWCVGVCKTFLFKFNISGKGKSLPKWITFLRFRRIDILNLICF